MGYAYPNPADVIHYVTRTDTSLPTPSATDVISRTPLPDTATEEELRLHAAEIELRQAEARIHANGVA